MLHNDPDLRRAQLHRGEAMKSLSPTLTLQFDEVNNVRSATCSQPHAWYFSFLGVYLAENVTGIRRVHEATVAVEKAKSITYSVCVCVFARTRVALIIQMQRAAIVSAASLAPSHFSTLSHKRHYFRGKKKLLNVKCMF